MGLWGIVRVVGGASALLLIRASGMIVASRKDEIEFRNAFRDHENTARGL